jgi:hypothetical protein
LTHAARANGREFAPKLVGIVTMRREIFGTGAPLIVGCGVRTRVAASSFLRALSTVSLADKLGLAEAKVGDAEAKLEKAEVGVAEAKVGVAKAEGDEAAVKRAEQGVDKAEVGVAEAKVGVAEAKVGVAEAKVGVAKAEGDEAAVKRADRGLQLALDGQMRLEAAANTAQSVFAGASRRLADSRAPLRFAVLLTQPPCPPILLPCSLPCAFPLLDSLTRSLPQTLLPLQEVLRQGT